MTPERLAALRSLATGRVEQVADGIIGPTDGDVLVPAAELLLLVDCAAFVGEVVECCNDPRLVSEAARLTRVPGYPIERSPEGTT